MCIGNWKCYLHVTYRDASDDRSKLLREVSSLLPLLANLENQVRLAKSTEPWFDCIRCLAIHNGPIDQLREALEELAGKLKVSMKIHGTFTAFPGSFENQLKCLERYTLNRPI